MASKSIYLTHQNISNPHTKIEFYEIKHDPVGVTQRNDYLPCEDSL